MYNDSGRGQDTLKLTGATTLAGVTGTSKGYRASGDGVVSGGWDCNASEHITVEEAGTVLTLAGAGEYAYYGSVGAADKCVSITKTGTGTQTFGGVNYFDMIEVQAGTLDLSGSTTTLNGAVNVNSAATAQFPALTLAGENSVITNKGSLTVANLTLDGASTTGEIVVAASGNNAIVSGTTTVRNGAKLTVQYDTERSVEGLGLGNLNIADGATLELKPSGNRWGIDFEGSTLSGTVIFGAAENKTVEYTLKANQTLNGTEVEVDTGATIQNSGVLNLTDVTIEGEGTFRVHAAANSSEPEGVVTISGNSAIRTQIAIQSGATLNLSGVIDLTDTISNSGTVAIAPGTVFLLDKYVDQNPEEEDRTYNLIANSGNGTISGFANLSKASFQFQGDLLSARKTVYVRDSNNGLKTFAQAKAIQGFAWDGTLVISGAVADLTWNGGEDATWTTDGEGTPWTNSDKDGEDKSDSFVNADNVLFQTPDAEITLGSDVSAKNMTVTENMTLDLAGHNFNALTIAVAEGKTLTLSNSATGEGSIASLVGDISIASREIAQDGGEPIVIGGGTVALGSNIAIVGTLDIAEGETLDMGTLTSANGIDLSNISGTGTIKLVVGTDNANKNINALNSAFAGRIRLVGTDHMGELIPNGNVNQNTMGVLHVGGIASDKLGDKVTLVLEKCVAILAGAATVSSKVEVKGSNVFICPNSGATHTFTDFVVDEGALVTTMNSSAAFNGNLEVNGTLKTAANCTISGTIFGNGGTIQRTGGTLNITGTNEGTINVSGAVSFTGRNEGTFSIVSGTTSGNVALVRDNNSGTIDVQEGAVLDLGNTDVAFAVRNVSGTGTVKITNNTDRHASQPDFTNSTFAGTLDFYGKFHTASIKLGQISKVELSKNGNHGHLWGGGTVSKPIKFKTNYVIGDSSATTFTLAGAVEIPAGVTVTTGSYGPTVTYSGAVTGEGTLTVSSGTHNFSGTADIATLNQTGGTVTISGEVALHTLSQTGGTINGNGSITISDGTVTLGSTSNNFKGRVDVNAGGVLALGSNAKLLTDYTNTYITIHEGGELRLDNFAYAQLGAHPDYAMYRVLDGGKITINGATSSSEQGFTVASGKTGTFEMTQTGATLTLDGMNHGSAESRTIILDGALKIGGAGNIVINQNSNIVAIGGNGSLEKIGPGTLTINADGNTYSGGTTVSEGTLVVGAAGALGTGPVTVAAGATLNLTGIATMPVPGAKLAEGTFSIANGAVVQVNGKPVLYRVGEDGLYRKKTMIVIVQ